MTAAQAHLRRTRAFQLAAALLTILVADAAGMPPRPNIRQREAAARAVGAEDFERLRELHREGLDAPDRGFDEWLQSVSYHSADNATTGYRALVELSPDAIVDEAHTICPLGLVPLGD